MLLLHALQASFVFAAAQRGYSGSWSGGGGSSSQHEYPGVIAQTSNGLILGHAAPNRSEVTEFLGIPYAQPPVGDLRFAAPVKYAKRGFFNASAFGYTCPAPVNTDWKYPNLTAQAPRILNYFIGSDDGEPQNEDCLTLNIWTKSASHHLRPVFVLLYGGRFATGATNSPVYYGQFWADAEEVVVVTINYRTNVFGFPGVPNQVQNLGLRDQRLAIEWVRDNIASFGGDPSKINLIGQSAGSVSVDYWSYAYVNDPIVAGLISHSGNALSFPLNADGVAPRSWYNISAQLGCGSSGDTLSCMRTKRWEDIEAAANKLPSIKSGSPLRTTSPFYPVVDNETVFGDYPARSDTGQFARIPYLLGNNNFEQGLYQLLPYETGVSTTQAEGDAFLLSSFTCPNNFEATNRRKYGVPVWHFRYFGDWDNLRLYPTSGAYHGSDLDALFGNDGQVSGIAPSQAEEETTAYLQHTWAVFGDDPKSGLTNIGWPEFDPSSNSLNRIAYNDVPGPNFVSPSVYASPCSTVALAGAPT